MPHYIVSVTVFVKPENIDAFIAATRDNAAGSRGEAGCVRWDFAQAEDDAGRFLLFEAYKTKNDFTVHQQTPHYLKWKETVAPWMAQPRQGVKHFAVDYKD